MPRYLRDEQVLVDDDGTRYKFVSHLESVASKIVKQGIQAWHTEERFLINLTSSLFDGNIASLLRDRNPGRRDLADFVISEADYIKLTVTENEFGPISP